MIKLPPGSLDRHEDEPQNVEFQAIEAAVLYFLTALAIISAVVIAVS